MKLSKFFLMGTAIALTMSSVSLSALTSDDLVEKIRISRACPAAPLEQKEPVAQGWFSSFRQATGNAFRNFGDSLRTEGNKSASGQLKEAIKDGFFSAASAKIGMSLHHAKDKICNSVGNAFRTVGLRIKGKEATQTTTRVILDNLGLHKSSKGYQVESALKSVARATLKENKLTSMDEYGLVVEGLVKRGYATTAQVQAMDVNAIYLNALAEEELKANGNMTSDAFVQVIKLKGFEALENIKAVKAAPFAGEKLNIMDQYLEEAYKQNKLKQDFEDTRQRDFATPAA